MDYADLRTMPTGREGGLLGGGERAESIGIIPNVVLILVPPISEVGTLWGRPASKVTRVLVRDRWPLRQGRSGRGCARGHYGTEASRSVGMALSRGWMV